MEENADSVRFIKTVEELSDFPLDLLRGQQFACSVHYYRRGSVIVSNSNESEWIYIVKSGSCQVYKAIKTKPKERRRKHVIAKIQHTDAANDTAPNNLLPPIKQGCITSKSITPREANGNLKQRTLCTHLQLPSIAKGDEKRLVSRTSSSSDSGYASTQSDDEIYLSRKKPRQWKASKSGSDSDKSPLATTFNRVQVLTERGVFGLQSLLHDDIPSLSLVSNGAECVLISKQFLIDRVDTITMQRLRHKIPAYPSLVNFQSGSDDRVDWDAYKQK